MRLRIQMVAIASAGLAAGLAGCQTAGGSQAKFDDSRIAGMSQSELTEVNAAKKQVEEAKKELEAARSAATDMQRTVALAESEKKGIDAQLDAAKVHAKTAKENGEIAKIDEFPQVKAKQALVDAAKAKVSYLKQLESTQKGYVKLQEKQVDLAQAKVDAAGFATVQKSNPAEAKAMTQNPADFEAKVASQEAKVAQERASVAKHQAKAVTHYQEWQQAEQKVGAADRQALAPMPPTPDSVGQGAKEKNQREPQGLEQDNQQMPEDDQQY